MSGTLQCTMCFTAVKDDEGFEDLLGLLISTSDSAQEWAARICNCIVFFATSNIGPVHVFSSAAQVSDIPKPAKRRCIEDRHLDADTLKRCSLGAKCKLCSQLTKAFDAVCSAYRLRVVHMSLRLLQASHSDYDRLVRPGWRVGRAMQLGCWPA
jgi:hypothetical protein